MSLFFAAKAFATSRHKGQVRKYTGQPYIVHPAAVVALVKGCAHPKGDIIQAAAWLHDTAEDTDTTIYELGVLFGARVASLVEQVTNVAKPSDGNREVRCRINRTHLIGASPDGKTIKIADSYDNVASFMRHDPKFAKIYAAEKRLLLPILEGGNPVLWRMLRDLLNDPTLRPDT